MKPWATSTPWNERRLSTLRRMWREGKTSGQIAAHFDMSRDAVLGKIQREGLNRSRAASLTGEG